MKFSITCFVALSTLFISPLSQALNPKEGLYGGLVLGGSYIRKADITTSGQVKYSGGGNLGGQIGYRINDFRIEVEPSYLYSPIHEISAGGIRFTSQKFAANRTYLKGFTGTASAMLNGFYDLFSFVGRNDVHFVPYVGAGVGYALQQNNIKLINTGETLARLKESKSTTGAQGIVGMSYYMDDFSFFALDYRYFGTSKSAAPLTSKTHFQSINLVFNGAFDFG